MSQRRIIYRSRKKAVFARVGDALGAVAERLGGEINLKLPGLWRNWSAVISPEIASMARPLGRSDRTLRLGAEDPIAMQELSYFTPQIRRRVNDYLEEDFFDKVTFELIGDQAPLDTIHVESEKKPVPKPPRPENLGKLKHLLEEDSAVARSYRAYIRMFAERL